MEDLAALLSGVVPAGRLLVGDAVADDYGHDESLTVESVLPAAVVIPASSPEVAAVLRVADEHRIPVTARGSGTGLSGACRPTAGSIVVSFEGMRDILDIDTENHVAVVQPGVTLQDLDLQLAAHDLVYPVFPGEYSASLGGNVATNAGGMRAVKYGVTRHQVLGLEAVLPGGDVIRTGGKYVKATTGYDLTQLIVGSEGTLALVTEVTLKLYPRPPHQATVLAPFATLDQITAAIPRIVDSGIGPLILEYIDMMTMAASSTFAGFDLGIPQDVKDTALAYLVVMMENSHQQRLEEDVEALSKLLFGLGAIDAYVLPPQSAGQLIDAREKAFWMAKANGAHDIVDVVVPRAQIPEFMKRVSELATQSGSFVAGCGHAGDGNVHLGVFQADPATRARLLHDLFETGRELGGAISAEHGIGRAKRDHFLALEDPVKIALMQRIKAAFDPHGILNPGVLFATEAQT
jgi:glycolate oxidase